MFEGEFQETPRTSLRNSGTLLAKKIQFFKASGFPKTLRARFSHRLHGLQTHFS